MSTHSFEIQLRSPGDGPVPVDARTAIEVERVARQAVADSGLLPDGVQVVSPEPPAPPPAP